MHPADIKAALQKRNSSQAKIADTAQVSRAHVSYVIQGRSKSRRVADIISRVTGLPVDRMWPGKYIVTDHRLTA